MIFYVLFVVHLYFAHSHSVTVSTSGVQFISWMFTVLVTAANHTISRDLWGEFNYTQSIYFCFSTRCIDLILNYALDENNKMFGKR